MKRWKRTMTAAAILTLSAASPALADEPPTRPEMRQEIQQDLIFSSLVDGTLGWKQAKALLAEQEAVETWQARFAEDGAVSEREVKALEYMLDVSSRNIDIALRVARAERPKPAPVEDVRTLVAAIETERDTRTN